MSIYRFFILLNIIALSSLHLSKIDAATDVFFDSGNNLSNSHVNSMYQDQKGYIWICTENGLNIFNGTNFKTYYHILNDTTSLINNLVLSVLEDSDGRFWVGTTDGVQILDRETDKFKTIKFSYPNITDFSYFRCLIEDSKGNIWLSTSGAGAICIKKNSIQPIYYMPTNSNICSNKINVVYEDKFGNIWIGSQDKGVSVLNLENHTIVNYPHDPQNPNSLSSNKIFSITESPDGKILIATIDGGIDAFNYSTHSFERNYIPAGEIVFTMQKDSKNNLWIGTDGLGLKKYNFADKTIVTYESEIANLDLRKAKVHNIIEDKQGNIWVSLYQKGILMIPQREILFNNLGFNAFYPKKSIGTECVLAMTEDSNGDIWIGTDGNGIYRLDANREVKQHYDEKKLVAGTALSIFEDSRGNIWMGSYLHGLFLYNKNLDKFENIRLTLGTVDINHINVITEDKSGNLWIGTNEKGVCIYNTVTKETSFLLYDFMKTEGQILSNSVHTINFDNNDKVWIGTNAGLSCYDLKNNTFGKYTFENESLTNNNIFTVTVDLNNGVWVGTNYGLNYINQSTGEIKKFTENDGLPNASISGIEIDKYNNLWISTRFGLSHYTVDNNKFTNYYSHNGLISNEFRRGAYCKSHTNELFFGSVKGLSYFHPFKDEPSHALSNLVFTDLYIYNNVINANDKDNTILKRKLDSSIEIKLNHNLSNFSIGFTALEFNSPNNVIYQVKLEGFDNSWVTLPPQISVATYTNIAPGNYTLKVRASLPGTPFVERSLQIVITPPIWFTWWAKLIYIVILLFVGFYIYRAQKIKLNRRKENMEKKNENEIMQSKLQFFTDISHEIRTPLTLILTPVEQLIKETPSGKLSDIYKLISNNGNRILRLVNQVMDMNKIDKGYINLEAEETNVAELIRRITNSFHFLAQEKQILFDVHIDESLPTIMWIDQAKLEKVIFNVLSNAFKFTSENGSISVSAEPKDGNLFIRIKDTGIGIPKDMVDLIFNRFYQVTSHQNQSKQGTGIGLHLSKSLMELHHGEIYVENSDSNGTAFVITIPLSGDYLLPSEIKTVIQADFSKPATSEITLSESTNLNQDASVANKGRKKYKLLLVEDDNDIRNYITSVLSDEYNVIVAENGKIGLEKAIQELPDCVITDVMMPEMDGLTMCDMIKKNDTTSHIPVVMLTAKTSIEHRVEGLGAGADSYISKPFNIDHLRVRIERLIELRQTMKDKYEGKKEIDLESLNIKTTDEKFLEKLEDIVKSKIAEPDLSVENLSQELGLSRSQLQRKLKQLKNQNPSDYIKITRLRYAASLLASKKMTISEVTYATGFSSLSHFSNSFRESYGMSPSRYMEINYKETAE